MLAMVRERSSHLTPLAMALSRLIPEQDATATPTDEQVKKVFDGEIVLTDNLQSKEEDKRSIKIEVSGRDADKWEEALKELAKTGRRVELLYQSSLINLTNTVEWFMSQLFHQYFDAHPDAVGSRENVFSLNDLKSFGSIEDAKAHLIDTKVENILRGSFEDWIQFLKTNAKLHMGYLDEYMDLLVEVFQRRNIIVHNGGIVNALYLSKIARELKDRKEIGERITISRTYVDKSIGVFERTFVLIAAELWYKQTGEEGQIADTLSSIAFDHLTKERWDIAEGLSKFIMAGKTVPEITRLFAKLNYWQAVKWQGRYEEIKKDVETADFSGKGLAAQLALDALANRVPEFFQLLPEVVTVDIKPGLRGHRITYEDLDTWPIFREMRQDPLYATFREEHISEFAKASENGEQTDETSSGAEDVNVVSPQTKHYQETST